MVKTVKMTKMTKMIKIVTMNEMFKIGNWIDPKERDGQIERNDLNDLKNGQNG